MRLSLKHHPDTPCTAVAGIEVVVTRPSPDALVLDYEVRGALQELLIPAAATPQRGHRLWEHTCFEAFIRVGDAEGYSEFNFAPSGEWAAYRLAGYRTGMFEDPEALAPAIETTAESDRLSARVCFRSGLPHHLPWHVGISTIIEDRHGQRSFWALAHPAGEPDFHSPDCFALQLAPPPAA